jgi:hypothetical protein
MTSPRSFHFANAQIGTISSRQDKSIGFRVNTGEIAPENAAHFFRLQGLNVELLITPLDREEGDEAIEVKSEIEEKTLSQRIRAALYVLYKQKSKDGESFRDFYEHWQTKWLEHIKGKLEPEN